MILLLWLLAFVEIFIYVDLANVKSILSENEGGILSGAQC
jgi:hypothetical protein